MKNGDRVELHPGLDDWMKGNRYGEVRKITVRRGVERVHVLLDKSQRVKAFPRDHLTVIS